MPEVTIQIGGRQFEVACQAGEEPYLEAAAKMLDDEAQVLSDQVGRMPEGRMLLMAGLMLADKAASIEDRIAEVEAALQEKEQELAALRDATPSDPGAAAVAPAGLAELLDETTRRVEAMADAMDGGATATEPGEGAPTAP